jgi:selenide, water dikinase
VWRLDDDRALVVTVDVLTPLVDDARTWGMIAAANSASDVYAMGGRPLFALNIVGWNREELPLEQLSEVLAGAQDTASEGGWVAVGGHTIDDPEPKFGQAVVGEVRPDRLLRNDGLRPGDALVLTKPLGTGVVTTALKAGRAPEALVAAAVASMTRLNAEAARAAVEAGASGATDVTGFGLLGHARRMVDGTGCDLEIDGDAVPLFGGIRELAAAGFLPGGSRRNLAWVRERLDANGVDEVTLTLLADAQTSGGLLFGAEPGAADRAVADLRATGHDTAVIGRVLPGNGRLHVLAR